MDLRHVHLIATKHILKYLKDAFDYGLKYKANQNINLEGHVDSDWVVLGLLLLPCPICSYV